MPLARVSELTITAQLWQGRRARSAPRGDIAGEFFLEAAQSIFAQGTRDVDVDVINAL